MPSRNKSPGLLAVVMLLSITAPPLFAAGSSARAPDEAQIEAALAKVKADPNLATERTLRTLKWAGKSQPQFNSPPAYLAWLIQFFRWFAQTARVLVWAAGALLAGLLAVYLVRLIRAREPTARISRATAPTHVQDLDIRPESLPDNIGAVARKLWDSGEHRAALSLLYRGVLSRLVHVHNVPIRASSTEGDCLRLSAPRLKEEQKNYVTLLIQVWQHAVYGGQEPEAASLYTLCDGFAPALDVA
ncbi:MAG: DUF4129 domain-containing protein [Steroidobacteraceae bacterium]